MKKSITLNGLYKLALNLFRFTLPALIIPYVYRTLSPENIGSVNYAESIYSYFNLLAVLGLSFYAIRELGRVRYSKLKASFIFSNIFTINIIMVSFSLLLYLTLIIFMIKDPKVQIISLVLSIKLLLLAFDIEWVNESFEDYKFISIKTMLCRSISLVLMFLLITSSDDYIIYVWLNVLFDLANSIFSFYYIILYRKRVFFSLKFVRFNKLYQHLKKIISTLFIVDVGFLFFSFDKVSLGAFVSTTEVAYFALSEKIIVLVVVISSTITQVTLPRLSILAKTNKSEFLLLIRKIYTSLMMIVLPSFIGVYILTPELLFIFGSYEFMPALETIKIFSFYILLFSFLKILATQALFALNKEKFYIILLISFSIINVIVKCLINEKLNSSTSIIITLSLLFAMSIIIYIYITYKEKIRISIINKNICIYLIGCLPMLLIPLFRHQIDSIYIFSFLSISLSIILYAIVLLIFKESISQSLIRKILKR
ncbi:TPA: oligosaccharide flippase family protein [Morganella morganii]|uniref:oligosaccharide flippase family protein n=1 Tax=Morganella morganii TaxID=582 RepID=UPI00091C9C63|nr:oligosaccharide flippase family protein [Morganella morganii]SGD49975.1 Putative O-antigen transporter [Mycobacterium tuberculosis]ELA7729320.1 oligosaccharide flippase family protein [Morganella morganii]MBC4000468.1 oligosaccharide flippase family protein [Morganella morganii]MBT0314686.1 oligosaccharide flippase family protein [Morganella morganii subsp. morganii]MBT0415339.1 oligosaccharide flippase family protein [Morganella morganii subsp. morganii]